MWRDLFQSILAVMRGYGFKIGPVGDSDAMASNILAVWNGNRSAMSEAATRHAHQFSWDRSMEELFGRVYVDALAARGTAIGATAGNPSLAKA